MNETAKRKVRVKLSQSLLDEITASLKNGQAIDERIESLLLKGLNHEGLNLEGIKECP